MRKKMSNLSEKDKNLIFSGVVIGSVVTLLATLITITICQNIHMFSLKDINNLNTYTDIIEKMYYKDIDVEKMKSDMYNGLFSSLDEYSCYISKDDYNEIKDNISKRFYGVGILYSFDSYANEYRIVDIYENSPADKSGIKVNDIIKEIDDVKISKMKVDEVVNLIRGDKDTIVHIKILRNDELLDYYIKRDEIKVKYSRSYKLSDETGYISIDSFEGEVSNDFCESLNKIKDSDNIIIDLRNNPGGDIEIMLDILRQIAPDGLVVTLNYKDGSSTEFRISNGVDVNYNFVILVNGNSASCSEIMTAFMQENNYATVIGEQTFGKGIVQGLHELDNGAAIKLTIGSYLTPNGKDLGSVGLTPDILTDTEYKQITCLDDVLNDFDVQKALDVLN